MRPRIVETDNRLNSEIDILQYDAIMKNSRDKGYLYTKEILKFGIDSGFALEIGPGPGYLGLEWLKYTKNTKLIGIDINEGMIRVAEKNFLLYGFDFERAKYFLSDGINIPYPDNTFDSVFSNASLHEWREPEKMFNEIYRTLKPGGKYFISDLRRDMNFLVKSYMKRLSGSEELYKGFLSSLNASYTSEEITSLLQKTNLIKFYITKNPFSIFIKGVKN